jgi:hypothetical protein
MRIAYMCIAEVVMKYGLKNQLKNLFFMSLKKD